MAIPILIATAAAWLALVRVTRTVPAPPGRLDRAEEEALLAGRPGAPQVESTLPPSPRHPSVSVVVPTLNEAASLGWVLERLPGWVSEVVLVDGLSNDETERVARRHLDHAQLVVVHQGVRGKGAALRAGFAAASGDIVVMIDADGSTNPLEMDRFVQALEDGAGFVKGSRSLAGGGSSDWTRLRSAGNRMFVALVNGLYGARFTDLCYGYCAFWRRDLDALGLSADGFEIETELILSALEADLDVREVPSFELPRRAGTSNLNAAVDGWRVLRTIFRQRLSHRAARRATARIELRRVELAAPGTRGWVPAGSDLRRVERRVRARGEAGYGGPERRTRDRRERPHQTVTVLRAVETVCASATAAGLHPVATSIQVASRP